MTEMLFTREILEALTAAFPDDEIEFLPRAQSGGKALGLAYIDARSVMRRLDAVVGPANWSYDFDVLDGAGKMVRGKLTVLGVTKCDAGEAAQEDEPLKSAVSDALKRAAVHFGIGRYLYYLPRVWAPYDAQKRRFIEQPKLDPAAVRHALQICGVSPANTGAAAPVSRPAQARSGGNTPAAAPVSNPGQARAAGHVAGAESQASYGGTGAAPRNIPPRPPMESSGDRQAVQAAQVCSVATCGKALTQGQAASSVRGFGEPLCPACQKLRGVA